MNSAVYVGRVAHVRREPRRNSFSYGVYMLYLDLDELDTLGRDLHLFGHNRPAVYSLHDSDHFRFIDAKEGTQMTIAQENVKFVPEEYRGLGLKQRALQLLRDAGCTEPIGRVCLLTNPRVFGYVFNPVSFYYCFDVEGNFRALISEVNNTFGEQKAFVHFPPDPSARSFHDRKPKRFYVSPYIDYDNELDWRYSVPGETLTVAVDSYRGDSAELRASFAGRRTALNDRTLLTLGLRYPLLTVMIITRIHWHALKLFLKGIRFRDKAEQDRKSASEIARTR